MFLTLLQSSAPPPEAPPANNQGGNGLFGGKLFVGKLYNGKLFGVDVVAAAVVATGSSGGGGGGGFGYSGHARRKIISDEIFQTTENEIEDMVIFIRTFLATRKNK